MKRSRPSPYGDMASILQGDARTRAVQSEPDLNEDVARGGADVPGEEAPEIDDVMADIPVSSEPGVDFEFDRVIYSNCPVNPHTDGVRGPRRTGLNATTIGQLYLHYLFGVTQRQMSAMINLMQWKDDDGGAMFKAEELVSPKMLSKLATQLPLLPIYLKKVEANSKGVVSTALQATHSVPDIVRRLLQQTSLDVMTFAAKTGLRDPPGQLLAW
jgi:hypothetical protein